MTSKQLYKSVQERPVAWWSIIAVALILVVCAEASAVRRHIRVKEIRDVLAIPDDCAFAERWNALGTEEITPDDESQATGRVMKCTRKMAEEAASAYANNCENIVKRIGNGLTSEDEAHIAESFLGATPEHAGYFFGADAVTFARRIALRELVPSDLGMVKDFPCGPIMRAEYLKAASSSTAAWTGLKKRSDLGEGVRIAFRIPRGTADKDSPPEATLFPAVLTAVTENAEQQAKKLGVVSSSKDGADVEELCLLAFEITDEVTQSCTAHKLRREQLFAKEQAAEAAAERARQAKEAAEERAREAKEAAEERARKAKEAQDERICRATTAASQQCHRSCDAQWGWDDDLAFRCELRCFDNYPIRGCD